MPTANDSVGVTDEANAAIITTPSWFYKCPSCGKAMKRGQDAGVLVCKCGNTASADDLEPEELPGAKPNHPCGECGKETKKHHDGGRICSSRVCPARAAKLGA